MKRKVIMEKTKMLNCLFFISSSVNKGLKIEITGYFFIYQVSKDENVVILNVGNNMIQHS